MNVGLRKNLSPKNQIGKSLGNATIFSVRILDETNIMAPEFLLEATLSDVVEFNYVTIGSWNRNYFITDITTVRNGILKVKCEIDVLESWKDEILENKALIKRQSISYNKYINDGTLRVYNKPVMRVKEFTNGFEGHTNPTFVLSVAGG